MLHQHYFWHLTSWIMHFAPTQRCLKRNTKRREFDLQFHQGHRGRPLLPLVSVSPWSLQSRAAYWQWKNWWGWEETVSSIWGWQRRLECPRPEQPASLCCHVDNSPHTLGSPRRAVMRASGVELVLLALLFWKAAMHSSYYNTYTPALCTYCKHASHERKPGWVSVLCSESSD